MNMHYITFTFISVALMASCKGTPQFDQAQYSTKSSADSSYNYLDDGSTSAATDDSNLGTSSGSASVDSTVSSDITESRITDMASKMLKDLDTDASGSLSLEEYLAGPAKFAAKVQDSRFPVLTDDQKLKMTDTLTADFQKYAGDDALLSVDELKTLLLAQAPRIADFRRQGHGHGVGPGMGRGPARGPGQGFGPHGRGGPQSPMQPVSEEEIFKKFDTNADGKLDQAEFSAMLAARRHGPQPIDNPVATPTVAPTSN